MSPRSRCPVCNQGLLPPDRYVGKNWRCPACEADVVVHADGRVGRWEVEPESPTARRRSRTEALVRRALERPRLPDTLALGAAAASLGGLAWPLVRTGAWSAAPDLGRLGLWILGVTLAGVVLAVFKLLDRSTYRFPVGYALIGLHHVVFGAIDFPRFASVPSSEGGLWGRLLLTVGGLGFLLAWELRREMANPGESRGT